MSLDSTILRPVPVTRPIPVVHRPRHYRPMSRSQRIRVLVHGMTSRARHAARPDRRTVRRGLWAAVAGALLSAAVVTAMVLAVAW